MELPAIESESLVYEIKWHPRNFLSTTIQIYRGNPGEPSPKAKYKQRPIVN